MCEKYRKFETVALATCFFFASNFLWGLHAKKNVSDDEHSDDVSCASKGANGVYDMYPQKRRTRRQGKRVLTKAESKEAASTASVGEAPVNKSALLLGNIDQPSDQQRYRLSGSSNVSVTGPQATPEVKLVPIPPNPAGVAVVEGVLGDIQQRKMIPGTGCFECPQQCSSVPRKLAESVAEGDQIRSRRQLQEQNTRRVIFLIC